MTDAAALWAPEEVGPAPAFQPGNLSTKFVEPPFSVLDTRGGRWQERRRAWLSLGIQSELGRDGRLLSHAEERKGFGADYDTSKGENAWGGSGTSIFDPVLCELAYRWWAPEGGLILDPFAGGSVRGLVAAKLGHPYTGLDLSAAQLEANRGQAGTIVGEGEPLPAWLHGDSRRLEELLPAGQLYDMVFSCPPYFDLEVYSDDPADLSNAGDYGTFLEGYREVIARAAGRLHPERFLVLVVSEIRDGAGYCHGFVPDTVEAGRAAGLRLYNEAVLVNSAGSLPLRVTRYMEASRKLGRAHQNVLCFLKGSPPRGWSYDRAAPPSPQLDLHLLPDATPEPGPTASAPGRPAAEEAPPAPVGASAPDAAPDASWASGPADVLLEEEAAAEMAAEEAEWRAVEALEAEVACSRPYCILPAGHAMGHQLVMPEEVELSEELGEPSNPRGLSYDQLEDGRWVDNATGELFEANPDGSRGGPYTPPTAATEPAAASPGRTSDFVLGRSPEWQAASLSAPPMPLEEWLERRPELYRENDPDRPCWGCGRAPIGVDRDGGPLYERHTHVTEGTP